MQLQQIKHRNMHEVKILSERLKSNYGFYQVLY